MKAAQVGAIRQSPVAAPAHPEASAARMPEPNAAAVETRSQPKLQKTDAPAAPDTEAVASRARETERDRVSTIYDLVGRLNLERGFAEDLVKRGVKESYKVKTYGRVSNDLSAA